MSGDGETEHEVRDVGGPAATGSMQGAGAGRNWAPYGGYDGALDCGVVTRGTDNVPSFRPNPRNAEYPPPDGVVEAVFMSP